MTPNKRFGFVYICIGKGVIFLLYFSYFVNPYIFVDILLQAVLMFVTFPNFCLSQENNLPR